MGKYTTFYTLQTQYRVARQTRSDRKSQDYVCEKRVYKALHYFRRENKANEKQGIDISIDLCKTVVTPWLTH